MTPSPTLMINLDLKRDEINNLHDKAIDCLIAVGNELRDVQAQIDDTTFSAFVNTLSFSRSSAYNYMRLSEHVALHGSPTVGHALVSASVWYLVPPTDSETVNTIKQRLSDGKPVTKAQAKQLVSERAPLNTALVEMADSAPAHVADILTRNVVMDLDGNEIPLIDADQTTLRVTGDQWLYESAMRQRDHIEANSKKKMKVTAIMDDELFNRFRGREVTIYYEEDAA